MWREKKGRIRPEKSWEIIADRLGLEWPSSMRSMTQVGRAVEKGETNGFMKILVDAETKNILGASLLGIECDELPETASGKIQKYIVRAQRPAIAPP